MDYLTGLSDLELDKNIVDIITNLQKLDNGDKTHILTTINALVRDAKARNAYAKNPSIKVVYHFIISDFRSFKQIITFV